MLTGLIVTSALAVLFAAGMVWALIARTNAAGDAADARAQATLARDTVEDARREAQDLRARADASTERVTELSTELAAARERLEGAARAIEERDKVEQRFESAFKALSAEALKSSRTEFLAQAKPVFDAAKKEQNDLVKPIGETLEATRKKLEDIEQKRTDSFARMGQWMSGLKEANLELRKETSELVHALRRPKVRGSYGEVQLRRVAELAGLREGIDFEIEKTTTTEEGARLRPDMVVNLPSGRTLVIDAKTNIEPYLDAFEAQDPEQADAHLTRFAEGVASQAQKLSRKAYWEQFERAPDFVVMFVPGDQFVDAALQHQPELLTKAWERNIILASPTTLIGLLRAVELGWREKALAESAEELRSLGTDLHKRSGVLLEHVSKLGSRIGQSVAAYNDVAGSLERNFLPHLRKFEEAGAKSGKSLAEPKPVDADPRALSAPAGTQPSTQPGMLIDTAPEMQSGTQPGTPANGAPGTAAP